MNAANFNLVEVINYAIPFLIVLVSIALGFLIQKFALTKLIKLTLKTKIKFDEILLQALKGVLIFWFFILGLYIVVQITPLNKKATLILNKTILTVFIFSITILVANITGSLINLYTKSFGKTFLPTTIFKNIIKGTIIVIGILIILQMLGISIAPLLTALGVGGLAVALALQDTLSNFFAGLHILLSGQINIGDYIKLETGIEGFVYDITWRNTTIRKLPDNLIVIPNSKISSAILTNYALPKNELSVAIEVGVSYDSNLEKVEKITLEVAKEVMKKIKGGVPGFIPFMRFYEFADSSINFRVILKAEQFIDRFTIVHEFIKRLHKRFNKEKIEIPFPITTVYLKKR